MRYREIVKSVQFLVTIVTPDATRIVQRRGARTRIIRTRDRREVIRSCEDVACVRGYVFEASSSEYYEPPRVRPNDCPSRDHGTHMFVIRSVYEPCCLSRCNALLFFFPAKKSREGLISEFLIAKDLRAVYVSDTSTVNGEIYVNENVRNFILARSTNLVTFEKKSDTIFAENSFTARRGK